MAGRPLRRLRNLGLLDNPLEVDVRIRPALLARLAEQHKHFRSVSSLLSPIKQQSAVERFSTSKHDFRLVIHHEQYFPYVDDCKPFATRGQITLLSLPGALAAEEAADPDDPEATLVRPRALSEVPKASRMSVMTAWTYMHRVGDSSALLYGLQYLVLPPSPWDRKSRYNTPEEAVMSFWKVRKTSGYMPRRPTKKLFAAAEKVAGIRETATEALAASGMTKKKAESTLDTFIQNNTNSKMSREGYSNSSPQSLADWFAICEFTNNPVLLPSTDKKPAVRTILNTFARDMNAAFPPFYNALMDAFVGGVIAI